MKVKNVVFSGFMAAVLMSATGTASAAGVSVASQGYVDAKVSTATSAATSAVSALADTVAANKTAAENATKAVADDLADYETANNTAVSGLDTRLTTAEGTIGEHKARGTWSFGGRPEFPVKAPMSFLSGEAPHTR